MQTINTNSSSMLSTAALLGLQREYENPTNHIEGLILKGIETQLAENGGRETSTESIGRLEAQCEEFEEELKNKTDNDEAAGLESEIEEMERKIRRAVAAKDWSLLE